jgi:hypothetical protein
MSRRAFGFGMTAGKIVQLSPTRGKEGAARTLIHVPPLHAGRARHQRPSGRQRPHLNCVGGVAAAPEL